MPDDLVLPPGAMGPDPHRLQPLFGAGDDLLPLWVAEPYLPIAPAISSALRGRAAVPWAGYEQRSDRLAGAFWAWMSGRHGWSGDGLVASVSPSIGTSIGSLLHLRTAPGEGVVLQSPVFTDFKPLVVSSGRSVVKNPLVLEDGRYRMDLDGLERVASDPSTTAMILCNPHNPVGRSWTGEELAEVARICATHGVLVIADEIHADLQMPGHTFTPFAEVAPSDGWAALHGPIKTFGLAGVCDTLLITSDGSLVDDYRAMSGRLHLTRNNVFALVAFEAAYGEAGEWVDELVDLAARNHRALVDGLPEQVVAMPLEATYLGWLDLRGVGLEVPEIVDWLGTKAKVAMSPGHWFGREGAGFARITLAVPEGWIDEAIERITAAI